MSSFTKMLDEKNKEILQLKINVVRQENHIKELEKLLNGIEKIFTKDLTQDTKLRMIKNLIETNKEVI